MSCISETAGSARLCIGLPCPWPSLRSVDTSAGPRQQKRNPKSEATRALSLTPSSHESMHTLRPENTTVTFADLDPLHRVSATDHGRLICPCKMASAEMFHVFRAGPGGTNSTCGILPKCSYMRAKSLIRKGGGEIWKTNHETNRGLREGRGQGP